MRQLLERQIKDLCALNSLKRNLHFSSEPLEMSVKIAVIYDPPRSTHCAFDRICPFRGYGIDYTRFVCRALDLNCTFFWYGGDYGDAYENGTGTGLVGSIIRGEFDTSIPVISLNHRRLKFIDFSQPYDISDTTLITRAPSFGVEEKLNWNLVLAFNGYLWLSFAITLLLTAVAISLFMKISKFSQFSNRSVHSADASSFFDTCRSLILMEFKKSDLRSTSIRLIVCGWIIGGLVLTSAYSGSLFSKRIFVKYNLPFTDLETFVQCLEQGRCRIITNTLSNNFMQYLLGPHQLGSRIRGTLDRNPIRVTPADDIPDAILKENNQYLVNGGSTGDRLFLISGNRNCHFYTMRMAYFQIPAFPFAKNSSHPKSFNKILSSSRELGLMQAIKRKYMSESLCKEEWSSSRPATDSFKGQTLFSMATTFYFYALGVCIGFVGLVVEVISNLFVL